jgi:hypothetical protein
MKDPKPELGTQELNGNDRLEGNTGLISYKLEVVRFGKEGSETRVGGWGLCN